MLAHTSHTLAPYARINIFLAIISIPHARKYFKKNIKHYGLKSFDCVLLLYPKTSGAKKRTVCGTLYNRIIIAFCKHLSCFVPHAIFLQYIRIVFFKPLLQYKNGDFTPFFAFLLNYATRIVFYVVLSKSDKIRFFQNFVRCPSQSRLSNPRCRIPSYTTIATELDKLSERASLTIGILIDIS